MDTSIKLIIHKNNLIFDSVVVTYYSAVKYDEEIQRNELKENNDTINDSFKQENKVISVPINQKGLNAYLVSAYITTLINSRVYHRAAFNTLLEFLACKLSDRVKESVILIKLRTPKKQYLDYRWSERIAQMVLERQEVEHAMSWLSTLGGAFSALGEELEHCAQIAGKISVKQFELALRLGDPLLVARCKLYAALSLIQRGRLRLPKLIIRDIYEFAISQKDTRLQNMCLGVWAKLKYCYKLQRKRH